MDEATEVARPYLERTEEELAVEAELFAAFVETVCRNQNEAAAGLGVSFNVIRAWRRGRSRIPPTIWAELEEITAEKEGVLRFVRMKLSAMKEKHDGR